MRNLAESIATRPEILQIAVERGVQLKVYRWATSSANRPPLVFVAGWVSDLEGWLPLLRPLVARYPLAYVETREKVSARMTVARPVPGDFSIPRMAVDLRRVIAALGDRFADPVIVASSLGATIALEAMKKEALPARGAFLIGPNAAFRAGRLTRLVTYLPAATYHLAKHFVLWYLRTFRVDVEREPEQWQRYDRTLRNAHPGRLKLSAIAAIRQNYRVWPDLDSIPVPVVIAYAGTDTLHDAADIRRMADLLPAARLLPCPSNRYMHDADLKVDIDRFVDELKGDWAGRIGHSAGRRSQRA